MIRKAIRRQLGYVGRNLSIIAEQAKVQPLTLLSRKTYRDLLVIHELYHQQLQMWSERSHQMEDRIVSIHQPHIRPIVRGKAKARVEFGAKIAVSMTNGYAFLDRLSWDNFNESTTLIGVIEKYRERMGTYPAVVQVDQIYRTRENRSFCKQHGIWLSGPALGRKPKNGPSSEDKQDVKQDTGERNAIEGKFGEGKRKYGLGCIRARLAKRIGDYAATSRDEPGAQAPRSFCLIFAMLSRRRLALKFG
ncbi:hypothetical protein PACILC2_27730 [Paenibacillus cisolokensis]|uniref:Transposase DDE domain-containing protein n=1 Tax=Paenibacillus cisolokensis TaxID=1658519 RepID=A0ABQ4N7R3_9BACL|nr:hypothetical protein PACILC2_27730 [Paenibacillus cisolokensis]